MQNFEEYAFQNGNTAFAMRMILHATTRAKIIHSSDFKFLDVLS